MAAPSFRSVDLQSVDLSKLEFVKKLDARYECPVCKLVLIKPMQLGCGHHVCEKCLNKVFEKGDKATCPINDDEYCTDLSRNEVFPDASVGREILNLKVYCTNKEHGCNHVDTLRKIQAHLSQCQYQVAKCPNAGCTEKILKENYDKHIKSCPYKRIKCPRCNQDFPKIKEKEHDENECLEVEIYCPYKCDAPKMKRRNLPQHLETCAKRPDECAYKFFGCNKMGSELELKEHMINDVNKHVELMAIYISERDKNPMAAQHAPVGNVPDDIKAKISTLENGIKDLKLKIVGLTEKVITMERKLADLPRKTVLEQQARDIVDIKDRVATLTEQFRNMDGGATITRYGTLNDMADAFTNQLATQDRQLGNHDVRIAEMDLRFQILETASYNGVIIWKIKDYMRRKQDAVNGRTLSLYSQPFYTSKYGYKMCVRTYLNGDGMGRNTHVSLFFVVMGGEFDALLPWPFQQKVTLYIMDQGPGKRHLSDHFHPDATSTSFRRPVSEMNVASGCPLFVSHTVLESNSNQYLKDDTLFIRCNVDLNGLDNF
ncbi:hypothetical protein SNE40_010654 [Patella caerulea]|uniref:TNF receptor-associated factor 3 n=1 Tax=Patella caerulea TaxID=87958 RepID=A0AAN8JUW8_PATCE